MEFDHRAAEVFDMLRRARIKTGTMDLRIASVARVRDALLVSRNTKDFRLIPELRVQDWTR